MEFKDAGLQLRLLICPLRKIYSVHSKFIPHSMKKGAEKHQYENVAAFLHVLRLYNSIYQPNPQISAFPRQVCCCKMIRTHTQRDDWNANQLCYTETTLQCYCQRNLADRNGELLEGHLDI